MDNALHNLLRLLYYFEFYHSKFLKKEDCTIKTKMIYIYLKVIGLRLTPLHSFLPFLQVTARPLPPETD